MRLLLVVFALVGLLWNVQVALAGWFWNVQLSVEGVRTQVAWTVNDPDGADSYRAKIDLYLPEGAEVADVVQLTDKENVHVRTDSTLACRADGVEARAEVQVVRNGQMDGTMAEVTLRADGATVDAATGGLRDRIVVSGLLPADHPSCL